MLVTKIYRRICNYIWQKKRKKINAEYREKMLGCDVPTIFCCNCTGGVMYHDLGERFLSPTVNLYMPCEDFIKFCENYEYYFSLEMQPYNGNIKRDYPICTLGDLTLFMVHYSSFEEAKNKWNERKLRIKRNNIRVIATDRDGCTDELKERFQALPYKKVMFTHEPDIRYKDCFYIQGFEKEEQVGTVVEHEGLVSGLRYYDQFDWVDFLAKRDF